MDDLSLLKAGEKNYPDDPENAIIETFENRHQDLSYEVEFDCPEFTSMCPVTGQPDFAHIVIQYKPKQRCIESKALKLYLFSFRKTGMFHEHIVSTICKKLAAACDPEWLKVTGFMNARGGIAITVVATHGC